MPKRKADTSSTGDDEASSSPCRRSSRNKTVKMVWTQQTDTEMPESATAVAASRASSPAASGNKAKKKKTETKKGGARSRGRSTSNKAKGGQGGMKRSRSSSTSTNKKNSASAVKSFKREDGYILYNTIKKFKPQKGMRVQKEFGGVLYGGQLLDDEPTLVKDDDTGIVSMEWNVLFDDGDREDMSLEELWHGYQIERRENDQDEPKQHGKKKKSPRKKKRQVKKKKALEVHDDEEEEEEVDDSSKDDGNEDDEVQNNDPLYEVGQKVLARDQDGILYQAMIRRRLWGQHQHRQIQVGMVNSHEEMQAMMEDEEPETWHYFVHYFQWNVNWDRWVSQEDIVPITDDNLELSQIILREHKLLMKEFKQHTRHVDGGAFLTVWQEKLKKLLLAREEEKNPNKKKKKPATSNQAKKAALKKKQALLAKQAEFQDQSLWVRPSSQAQQLVLNYQLKKILVEEWELISQFQMVHALPASKPYTIDYVLRLYLKEMKGIEMEDKDDHVDEGEVEQASNDKNDDSAASTLQATGTTSTAVAETVAEEGQVPVESSNDGPATVDVAGLVTTKEGNDRAPASSISADPEKTKEDEGFAHSATSDNSSADEPMGDSMTNNEDESKDDDTQDWLDMVNGINMLFDEALPFRLLYPTERAQLQVLEKAYPDTPKSKLYGCEFLLRLFCQLPALLADTYKTKNSGDDDNYNDGNDAEIIKPILAKVYDFLRFLQTNQSTLFGLDYRKPNSEEIKQQTKIDRKKLKLQQQQQAVAAVASFVSSAPDDAAIKTA